MSKLKPPLWGFNSFWVKGAFSIPPFGGFGYLA